MVSTSIPKNVRHEVGPSHLLGASGTPRSAQRWFTKWPYA